jgi:hypothetical protein
MLALNMNDEELKRTYVRTFEAAEPPVPPFSRVWRQAQNYRKPAAKYRVAMALAAVAITGAVLTLRTAFRSDVVPPETNGTLVGVTPAPDRLLQFASTVSTWRAPSDFLLAAGHDDTGIRFALPAFERTKATSN